MKTKLSLALGASIAALPCTASAVDFALLDFDFGHGTVITNQYSASAGITISATGSQNTAIVYDSELGGANGGSIDGADPDLERLVSAGQVGPGALQDKNQFGWDGGNLGANYNAGGLLIIQENGPQGSPPTYGSGANQITSASNFNPDDDSGGGTITFDIDSANFTYNYFQVTLGDFEEEGADYDVTLNGVNGTVRSFSFNTFTLPFLTAGGAPTDTDTGIPNPNYDSSISSGNNHINILPQVSIFLDPTVEALDSVDISFSGVSGSVSSIIFSEVPIPEPSSSILVGLSSLLLLRRKR